MFRVFSEVGFYDGFYSVGEGFRVQDSGVEKGFRV